MPLAHVVLLVKPEPVLPRPPLAAALVLEAPERRPAGPVHPRQPRRLERKRLGIEHKVDRRLEVGVFVVPRRVALPLRRHLRVQPHEAARLEAGALELLWPTSSRICYTI